MKAKRSKRMVGMIIRSRKTIAKDGVVTVSIQFIWLLSIQFYTGKLVIQGIYELIVRQNGSVIHSITQSNKQEMSLHCSSVFLVVSMQTVS